jgi:hypothetical protein
MDLKEIKNKIEIDEEGYPLWGGIRIHDEDFLRDLFQNMRRASSELKHSKLISCVNSDTWVWIDAFDAPLVAQGAHLLSKDKVLWKFLGNLEFEIPLDDMSIDEWGRFHAFVGPEEIPALLSRKAQAQFLNDYAAQNLDRKFSRFRDPQLDLLIEETSVSDVSRWDRAYKFKETAWDLGGPHPFLKERLESGTLGFDVHAHQRLWVPGAGRGHDAVVLSQFLSSRVEAFDFSAEALQEFKALYGKSLPYECEDMFEVLKKTPDESVDTVFEHTFFCAISPLRRLDYVRELRRVLKVGGHWFGIFFLLEHRGGPPYSLTQWELREFCINSFSKNPFVIEQWERIQNSPSQRTHKELWAVFRKT